MNEQCRYGRALKLKDAIDKHSDFEICNVQHWQSQKGESFDLITIVLTCDGVPDASPSGILYEEKFKIQVGNDAFVPEVWPARTDFPLMMHMTVSPEHPPSLCLYVEDVDAVNRNWTPQKFLARIYWWVEGSAKGTLHSDEQPVEQLFYRTNYELVLPYNFTSMMRNDDIRVSLDSAIHRKNGGFSVILSKENEKDVGTRAGTLQFKMLTAYSKPVKHDYILSTPFNVKSLFALERGIGEAVMSQLRKQIHGLCGHKGATDTPEVNTIILLLVPIYRDDKEKVERYFNQAFLLNESPYQLGLQANFLFQNPSDKKLYIDNVICSETSESKPVVSDMKLLPMDVTTLNTQDDFATQSNERVSRERFTLVGLGALGSSLFDFWIRSGWGKWNLLDKDHIKPHNLTRHTTNIAHIGSNKATAACDQARYILGHTNDISVIEEDALRLSDLGKTALQSSALVIDASTSLDYPRQASFDDSYPRHVSVFVSPSGNDSVLLLEDKSRKIRLRTLEAQYYRLVLNKEWGRTHLDHHLGKFLSGGSCRDISLRLPFTSITRHSSTLAEQIKILSSQNNGVIALWQTNPDTGEMSRYIYNVHGEVSVQSGNYTIFYDEGLKDKLFMMRGNELPKETGGILVGYVDFNLHAIFIVDAFGPPVDSVATSTTFKRGVSGVAESVNNTKNRTAYIVDYIGEWHSHPDNTNARQSNKDIIQLDEVSELMAQDGMLAIQLIVGENEINVMVGTSHEQS